MIREGLKWYAESWLGGFEWTIFVGVDMLAYIGEGLLMLEGFSGCVGGALCHFVRGDLFSGAFEEATRWCA